MRISAISPQLRQALVHITIKVGIILTFVVYEIGVPQSCERILRNENLQHIYLLLVLKKSD
jgi:hypothetical protein